MQKESDEVYIPENDFSNINNIINCAYIPTLTIEPGYYSRDNIKKVIKFLQDMLEK